MTISVSHDTVPAGPRRRRLWLLVPPAALALGVLWARTRPAPVVATAVARGRAVEAVYATGTIEADVRRTLRARTGGLVAEVRVQAGDRVRAGDLLARVDATQLASDVRRGRTDLAAASAQAGPEAPHLRALAAQAAGLESDLKLARLDRDRMTRLRGVGAAPEADLDRAQTRVADLEAQLAANRAQTRATAIDLDSARSRSAALLAVLSARLDEAEIRAPIDGVVLWRGVEPGEQVARDQALFRVGDTRDLVIESLVDEADVGRVSDGAEGGARSTAVVSLYAFPGRSFRGEVTRVLPDAQRDRKAFLVKLRIVDAPPGLRSGMSAEVNIITAEKPDALVLPSEAVADGQVWVVRDGRARRVPVQLGVHDLLRSEALAGVAAGELVITEAPTLSEGRRVRPLVKPMDRLRPLPTPGAIAQSPF